ncbi:ABC transporter ATP-binding protein [Paraburkholderia fynbosensis]|uniref:Nitrate import ATP-binding protein NrtD n=1 Tax=Paraburkholderia fynbosensis TaxID=1200993 RepID=A0A6J5H2N6_9BURK|nr:ABC transporter ATP-binding protein [Paraburkholderia fynbosensis]CAB3809702.1 Nitrate import ATP-binding protein NrtD [Paraburkholderia fynbosensis]
MKMTEISQEHVGSVSQPDAFVQFKDVCYSYPGGTPALKDANFSIGRGEVVAMVGPSGCGKSTLLSLLAGLRRPDSGTLKINFSDEERRFLAKASTPPLTMVFQTNTVFPWMSVEKNIRFGLRTAKLSTAEKDERVSTMLQMGGLEQFRNSLPHQLSGGMLRRVALLAGIAPMPKILLLDEPFSALDEPTRVILHQDLLEIIRKFGITCLFVTHDIAEAVSLSDRVLVFGKRPTSVRNVHDIRFERPRDLISMRTSSEFDDAYGAVWRDLWAAIEEAKA